MLKIEDVKVGDELVCIDPDELRCNASIRLQWRFYMSEKDKITVSAVGADVIYIEDSEFHITKSVLQYFKKKEQSQQYTFDDLINMSTKAVKDRLFVSIKTDFKSIIALWGVGDEEAQTVFHNGKHNQVNCEYIQRLYKETFVIEDYEDIKRIKKDAQITLANNMKVKVFAAPLRHSEGWKVACADGKQSGVLDIFALKGATVEQERSRDD